MRKIYFGFSRPRDKFKPYAWIIKKRDNKELTHGYTRFFSPNWEESFIYQNSGIGTNFVGGSRFEKINETMEEYELEVPDEVEKQIGKLCISREGKRYGTVQVLGKGIVWAAEIIGKKIKNPFSDGDETTDCIEEQAIIIKKGLNIKVDLDMDSISVWPFRNFIAAIPNIKRIK